MANEDNHAELEERHGSLKRRLAEAEGELDRLLNLYATGEIDAEWLTTHVRDREGRIEHLKLLIASVESDMAPVYRTSSPPSRLRRGCAHLLITSPKSRKTL